MDISKLETENLFVQLIIFTLAIAFRAETRIRSVFQRMKQFQVCPSEWLHIYLNKKDGKFDREDEQMRKIKISRKSPNIEQNKIRKWKKAEPREANRQRKSIILGLIFLFSFIGKKMGFPMVSRVIAEAKINCNCDNEAVGKGLNQFFGLGATLVSHFGTCFGVEAVSFEAIDWNSNKIKS